MPGPVFLHFQTYARKESKGGNSVSQVVGEALRDPEFSTHVDAPLPPRVLHGDPSTFQADHDAHVADRATEVRVKGEVKRRAIRQDRHTLATIIASYPLTHAQIDAGGDEAKAHHAAWERRTIGWVRSRYGDQVRVVIAHDDEDHPHLHFWMLPDNPDADATMLHPGKKAKRLVEAQAKAEGMTPRLAVQIGNEALKDAMRRVIDGYHRDVGVPLGMTRDGPKRRRLSRVQWQAEKDQAQHQATILRQVETVDAKAKAIIGNADQQAKAKAGAFEALAKEVEAGTLKRDEKGKLLAADPAALRAGGPELLRAARAIVPAIEAVTIARAAAVVDRAAAAADRISAAQERREVVGLMKTVMDLAAKLQLFLRRSDVSRHTKAYQEGTELFQDIRKGMADLTRKSSPAPKKAVEDPDTRIDGP